MTKIKHRVALVTGTLAEPAMRRVASELAAEGLVDPVVVVLNIQVAALMTTDWLARKLALPDAGVQRVVLPGYCRGDLSALSAKLGVPVERGPANLHDLPDYFGRRQRQLDSDYGRYSIEIIAEINDVPRLTMPQVLAAAEALRADGADVIDLGCDPADDRPAWPGVAAVVTELRSRGMRVSIDSFHRREVAAAVEAGAELVLSVNAANRDAAADVKAEVVAVPDTPNDLASLDRTIEHLVKHSVPFRVDPVIEPIGFGFARSLGRYLDVRRRYPDAAMMMGVGNLTEMTEVDSAGVNMLLLGFCQELAIHSVLTTQVINWARSSVKEIDITRRVMHYALSHHVPPKHVDERLVMLRDPKLRDLSPDELRELAAKLTDRNVRLFAAAGKLHAMHRDANVTGDDPFALFDKLGVSDPSHAFYLGYELAKAAIALTLGKNYVQDEPLRWGTLTRDEVSHYENRKRKS